MTKSVKCDLIPKEVESQSINTEEDRQFYDFIGWKKSSKVPKGKNEIDKKNKCKQRLPLKKDKLVLVSVKSLRV